jgi:hypothetical protein
MPATAMDARELLVEREALLAADIKRKIERLKNIEDALKDIIDDRGGTPIIDEEFGSVGYQHSVGAPEWDLVALTRVLGPDVEKLTLKVENASVKALIDSGRVTERELAECATRKPRRGPLEIKPLPRSLR